MAVIDLQNAKIEFSENENAEIAKCLTVLFTTPMGTVVLDRDFGIDWSFLDLPVNQAKSRLTAEYINKVRRYEPRVRVTGVTFDNDLLNGTLRPTVRVENVNT